MKILKVKVSFISNEYTTHPTAFKLELTEEIVKLVQDASNLLKIFTEFESISIPYQAEYSGVSDEQDWVADGGVLKVFKNTVYYYEQSKYDCSDQIESEGIPVKRFKS
jgi:hypothetical protein